MNPEEIETANQGLTEGSAPEGTQVAAPEDRQVADAAFEAGFAGAFSGTEPERQPEVTEPMFAGYKESELKELLGKIGEIDALKQRESKVFGSLGSFKQQIDALRSQPTAQPGTPISLTKDRFKRLSEEFPELAEMIAEDLNGVIVGGGNASFDPSAVDQIVAQKLEGLTQTHESKLLTVMHKDWRKVVESPEFVTWKGGLPADERDQLDNSWDAVFIAEKIDAFKGSQAQAAQTKQNNQRRLEAAITPRGNTASPPAPSDDDAFLSGYKSVRGR